MARVLTAVLLALTLATPAMAGGFDDHDRDGRGRNDRTVTVMTRNLYFGADLTPAVTAQSVPALIAAVTEIFGVVQASDIPGRALKIAEEIAATEPDLVGLQEAVIWRSQTPADFSPTPNATTVEFDYVQLVLDALAAHGQHYEVVAVHVTNDIEAPALTATGVCCRDIRLTDREVILARTHRRHNDPLRLTNIQTGTFAVQAAFQLPSGPYRQTRGWASVDAELRGSKFRFITTHLDPEGPTDPIQEENALELLAGPANTHLPVVFVCDCNSRADGTGTATYSEIRAGGFDDAWLERHPHRPGLTCCQAEDLRNPTSLFDQRIDIVFVRARAHVERARRVGAHLDDRTPEGLWPSDHAGVVATIQFRH